MENNKMTKGKNESSQRELARGGWVRIAPRFEGFFLDKADQLGDLAADDSQDYEAQGRPIGVALCLLSSLFGVCVGISTILLGFSFWVALASYFLTGVILLLSVLFYHFKINEYSLDG